MELHARLCQGSVTNPADVKKAADNIKNNLKVYPLAKKDNPPKMAVQEHDGRLLQYDSAK